MNREIKFRVWDKAAKRMWDGWVLDGDKDGTYHGGYFGDTDFPLDDEMNERAREGWAYQKAEEVELMQFTGLKDKNGIEIYEGDIVSVPYNNIGAHVVEFKDGSYNTARYNVSLVRVVGNAYENPDLLTKAVTGG